MNNENELINTIINKIKELPLNTETTIAKLIDYNPQVNMVDPLTQGINYNKIKSECEKIGIILEENSDEIGGLGYYYKFKKKDALNKTNDNTISIEQACEIALNYYKQFGYSSIGEIKDTGDKLLIIPQNWERKVGEHLIMIDKVSGKEEQCIMPLVLFEDLVSNSSNVDVPAKYSDGNSTNITAKKDIEDVVNEVVAAIEKLPKETEISISEILNSDIVKYDTKELFEINKKVIKKCEEIGIKLNFDKYKGQIVGLPFHIPFIKE